MDFEDFTLIGQPVLKWDGPPTHEEYNQTLSSPINEDPLITYDIE